MDLIKIKKRNLPSHVAKQSEITGIFANMQKMNRLVLK